MPEEVRRHRRFVAARRAVAADRAGLQVRRVGNERRAFPRAGGEAAALVRRVLRRMRAAVHPDRRRRLVFPGANLPVDRRPGDRICFVPDLHAERTHREIERRPHAALAFDHRQLRRRVAQRLGATVFVQRQSGVVHRIWTSAALERVFMIPRRPRPGEFGLGKCRDTARRKQHEGKQSALDGYHVDEHAVGSQPFASACFLNCVLMMNG